MADSFSRNLNKKVIEKCNYAGLLNNSQFSNVVVIELQRSWGRFIFRGLKLRRNRLAHNEHHQASLFQQANTFNVFPVLTVKA